MSWEFVNCGNTEYAIDFAVVERICRSYYTAKYQYDYAREIKLSDSKWYNPLSWWLPDVSNIEVNWEKVTGNADQHARNDTYIMQHDAPSSAPSIAYKLAELIEETAIYKEKYLDWMGNVQTQNMANINDAVEDYEAHVETAKLVRDLSAEGLMVGAAVLSGGAAVTVLGAGSFLKGTAKFQDTGSIGAGLMEGAGSFVFGYVKLGKKFSLKQDVVLAIVQAPYKAYTEIVGGMSFTGAVLTGSLKLTSPAVERLFKIAPAKSLFDRVAVPWVVKLSDENVTSELLTRYAGKVAQNIMIEKKGRNALLDMMNQTATVAPQRGQMAARQKSIINETTISTRRLLNLAFVNMNKGIGNGW